MFCPLAAAKALTTSITLAPSPLPRLQVRCCHPGEQVDQGFVAFRQIHHVDVTRTPVPSWVGQSLPNAGPITTAYGDLAHRGRGCWGCRGGLRFGRWGGRLRG